MANPAQKSQATTAPIKTVAGANEVEVVAAAKGYNSNEGRTVQAGETFIVTRDAAKRGASWFEVKDAKVADELEAEVKAEAKKATAKTPAAKADTNDLA